jgi:dTDP-4-dehydrorhamnose 3,5-epimerase-like enzyme
MAKIFQIPSYKDSRGGLSVIEKFIPFNIKRVYFLYNLNKKTRGKHRHKKNKQFLICLSGKIQLKVINKKNTKFFNLSKPTYGIYLAPQDWHEIIPKKRNSIVLVIASSFFDKKDYLNEI